MSFSIYENQNVLFGVPTNYYPKCVFNTFFKKKSQAFKTVSQTWSTSYLHQKLRVKNSVIIKDDWL